LKIRKNNIGEKGAEIMSKGNNFDNIVHLNVKGCSIGDKGLRELMKSKIVLNLKHLILDENGLTDESAKVLGSSCLFEL
jgi:hypothetical protein